jgi:hypothetical protein
MDDRTIFPEGINTLIDSYVDLRQVVVEMPGSKMYQYRDLSLQQLQLLLTSHRNAVVGSVVSLMLNKNLVRRHPARNVLHTMVQNSKDYIKGCLLMLHRIKAAIRYFNQKNIYYISKDYRYLWSSAQILEHKSKVDREEWRRFVQDESRLYHVHHSVHQSAAFRLFGNELVKPFTPPLLHRRDIP